MRLSKISLRKLYKYFDLFDFLHLYIAIRLPDNTIIYPNTHLDSVPHNTATSILVYDRDLDTRTREFFSINSFLRYYSPIYKNRFFITRNNYPYEREIY